MTEEMDRADPGDRGTIGIPGPGHAWDVNAWAIPCTPWTQWQHVCIARFGPEYAQGLEARRAVPRQMVRDFMRVAQLALEQGGEVSFEWPHSCSGWLLADLIDFITRSNFDAMYLHVPKVPSRSVTRREPPHLSPEQPDDRSVRSPDDRCDPEPNES